MNNVNFQLSKDYLNKWMDKQLGFEYIVYLRRKKETFDKVIDIIKDKKKYRKR